MHETNEALEETWRREKQSQMFRGRKKAYIWLIKILYRVTKIEKKNYQQNKYKNNKKRSFQQKMTNFFK